MENIVYPIYLIGMPGSGKSLIAKKLALKLGINAIDLDHEIEKNAHMFIHEIFETYGEATFRIKETECLKNNSQKKAVIACGGGIILNKAHKDIMKKGTIIYIMVDVEHIEARIQYSQHRPLLKQKSLKQLYEERMFKYLDFADTMISNEGHIDETIDRIMTYLKGINI